MAFSLLKDIGASRAPHQKVGWQVMCTKNISCHNKKGRNEWKKIQPIEKKSWQESGITFKKANTAENHYRQTVFNGLLALSWSSLHP